MRNYTDIMKKILLPLAALTLMVGFSYGKKVLDHDSFDAWNGVRITSLSNDGRWAAYEVNPQEGDGVLTLRSTSSSRAITVPRGYKPAFTADSRWAVAQIKPLYADTRQAKIKGKKDFALPQDSLALINLTTGQVQKIPSVISYKVGKRGGNWVAYLSCDTAAISEKALKDKKAGRPLVVRDLKGGQSKTVNWVKDYIFSEDGSRVAASLAKQAKDTTATNGIGVINLPDTNFVLIDRDKPFYGAPVFSRDGRQLSYVASSDSAESGTRRSEVYLANLSGAYPEAKAILTSRIPAASRNIVRPHSANPERQKELEQSYIKQMNNHDTLFVNQYVVPRFSYDGRRLIAGVAPYIAPDDTTIVDFERADLDIWRWDAPYTPPQELKNVDQLRKENYPVVIDLTDGHQTQLTDNLLTSVSPSDRWDGEWVLLRDGSDEFISRQWNYAAGENLSALNLNSGEIKNIGKASLDNSWMSPKGKYVIWYDDKAYYTYDNRTGQRAEITLGVPYPIWEEEQDIPMMRQPYGIAGWMANDDAVLVYDRFDIWSLDPSGKRAPVCLTAGDGRKNNRRYRYVRTDADKQNIAVGDEMLLSVFDFGDKRNGFATLKAGKSAVPSIKVLDTYSFTQLKKAKDANVYAFQKANFNTSPDVWIATDGNFAKAKRVTDANPQMKDYNWGDAQLVKWYSYSGDPTEGVLYTPEDLDPDKKYPMLVVFYERNSEELYRHYTMEPSWSWVNYPFYVSRGYVIFVPDVKYAPGIPGESAYNYICSGVEELCKKYPWIDKDRIGIDGQSWGGYQTAFLVTRTNMFACAGSGAPVANMTSAFGGIRWGSGDSRQAQYENGQSRIGRNLWEAPQLYIANSPVFYADRVNTPLLIMHNDQDGAVPWYQGIEMFMALRRLHKPVWMLQYNGEAHNIRARKNRKDITIRLQQFFDHYLKGDPMPVWMKDGIPVLRKGQDLGTSLTVE